MSYSYHCFEDSYDVLESLEEKNRIYMCDEEDDNYWSFHGPPIYDS